MLFHPRRLDARQAPLDVGGDRRRLGVRVVLGYALGPCRHHSPVGDRAPSASLDGRDADCSRTKAARRLLAGKRRLPVERGEELLRVRRPDALRLEVGPETPQERVPPSIQRLLVLAQRSRGLRHAEAGLHVQAQEEPVAGGKARRASAGSSRTCGRPAPAGRRAPRRAVRAPQGPGRRAPRPGSGAAAAEGAAPRARRGSRQPAGRSAGRRTPRRSSVRRGRAAARGAARSARAGAPPPTAATCRSAAPGSRGTAG